MDLTWDLYNPASRAGRILVVAPSIGGNCSHQWAKVAELLTSDARVVFVDYPGHALSEVWNDEDEPTLDVVASAIMDVVHEVREQVGELPVFFAGLSIGGATGLHLARDHADELAGVAVLCSAATVGEPDRWIERAEQVETSGTQQLVEETSKRWFTPAFKAANPRVTTAIMEGLAAADDHSYAQLCRCLAHHDLRADLTDIRCPLLLIAGERDSSTPIANQELVAETVPGAQLSVIPEVSHQVTVAAPDTTANLLRAFMDRVARQPRKELPDD